VLLWTLWRSGTHWLGDMLYDLTRMPAVYESPKDVDYREDTIARLYAWPPKMMEVRHVCMYPHELLEHVESLGIHVVFLYRDPRDVIASNVNYRKYRGGHIEGLPAFPDMSISAILSWELDHLHEHYTGFLPAWVEAEHPWMHKLCYETLMHHTLDEMTWLVQFLGLEVDDAKLASVVDQHRFEERTGRAPGEEDRGAHERKGIIGDYRNVFSAEEQSMLQEVLGDALARMGYAMDAPDASHA
jgi:hypothetical protein